MPQLPNKIDIFIHAPGVDGGESTPGQPSSLSQAPQASQMGQGNAITWKQAVMFQASSMIGREAFNFAVGNYGDLTGDMIGQTRLTEGLNLSTSLGSVALAFAIGGPTGGILASTAMASQTAVELLKRNIEIDKLNKATSELNRRRGSYINGGGRS